VFGVLYFSDAVPITVQRKMGHVALFTRDWALGAGLIAANFALVFVGCSITWYKQLSLLVLAPILFFSGAGTIARERRLTMLAPIAFALAYIGAFVGSGRQYALYFPWYFMPPLVAFTLVAAIGVARFARAIDPARVQAILTRFALVWTLAMTASCFMAARTLARIVSDREQVYAAATLWLGRYLPADSRIAANEIGTIGFFLRGDLKVLDLFGLLRTREDRTRPAMELMAKYRPEAVITKKLFDYRDNIDVAQPGAYTWVSLQGLLIGLRADLAPELTSHRAELDALYAAVDVNHEIDHGPAR
jgi:hypothetical protein